jgi:hypothetical protein
MPQPFVQHIGKHLRHKADTNNGQHAVVHLHRWRVNLRCHVSFHWHSPSLLASITSLEVRGKD